MKSFAAGAFAEGGEAELFQARLHLLSRFNHNVEANIRRRVEVEYQAARHWRVMGLVVPGMILDGGDLCGGDQ